MPRSHEEPERVEITYEDIVHETDRALLLVVPTYGDKTTEIWMPKSQIHIHDKHAQTMLIPEWLATEKGLT